MCRYPVPPIRERSGAKDSPDALTSFLYLLIRDHLPCGQVEEVMRALPAPGDTVQFSNGWLASYAEDLARRIRGDTHEPEPAHLPDLPPGTKVEVR